MLRLNAGQFGVGEGKRRRFVMGQEKGTPDLMAFRLKSIARYNIMTGWGDDPRPEVLFVECKRPGNKPTPIQLAKMAELETYGAVCIVATSIEDIQAFLEGGGD